MPELTANQESFVGLMRKSDDHARRGFDILSKRDDAPFYFDALSEAGLLDASNNHGPEPVPDNPNAVRIPYWPALDYLVQLARIAGKNEDVALAHKVLSVVWRVSEVHAPNGQPVDNHYTFAKFAEIVGLLPLSVITDEVLSLIPSWLKSKYDNSMAGNAVGSGILTKLLQADTAEAGEAACRILGYITAVEWASDEGADNDVKTVVEDYWLKEILNKHIAVFGRKLGPQAARILTARVREVFGDKRRPYQSSLWRPAVETSAQNHDWRGAENRLVEGLRDELLAWIDTGAEAAKSYVRELLTEKPDILPRIALHVIDERFDALSGLMSRGVRRPLFASVYHHELYRLLSRHFAEFPDHAKSQIVAAIRAIKAPRRSRHRDRQRRQIQREWASAIRDKGYRSADELFHQLNDEQILGKVSDHPDFLTYHEMRSGPGESPYSPEVFLSALEDGKLVELVGSFHERNHWEGPTSEGMWAELQTTVTNSPSAFLAKLDALTGAPAPVLHAIIKGFQTYLSASPSTPRTVPPEDLWPPVLKFFEGIVSLENFWAPDEQQTEGMVARKQWVVSAIADMLATGTNSDETAYDPKLLPQGWRVLKILLARAPGMINARGSDVVMEAINTPRGRAIEAVVSHALRACRVAAKDVGEHATAWKKLQGVFDEQLKKAADVNFEYLVILCRTLPQMQFMSTEWLEKNFGKLFDKETPDNFNCAVAGLYFGSITRLIYQLLVRHDVVVPALDMRVNTRIDHDRMVDFMCLALLWGEETLDSLRFDHLFEIGNEEDIGAAIRWFWSVRGDKLSDQQVSLIFAFWRRVIEWAKDRVPEPKTVLSRLSGLAVYVKSLDDETIGLLEPSARHINRDFNLLSFTEDLLRVAGTNPAAAGRLFVEAIGASRPIYDYEDRIKKLIQFLAANGQQQVALEIANKLRSLPGMTELFAEIGREPPAL